MRRKWILSTVILATIGAFSAGCGSDKSPPPNSISLSNNGNHVDVGDTSTPDVADAGSDAADGGLDAAMDTAGDAADVPGDAADTAAPDGGSCPGTPCPGDKTCVGGSCVDVTPQTECSAAEDLGTLSVGSTLTASGSLVDATDAMQASCGDSNSGGEKVFHFQTADDSRINYKPTWAGNFAGVVDFRTTCDDASTALACAGDQSAIGFVPAGTDVYMVVEMAQGVAGNFTVDLTASAQSCQPGDRTCSSGQVEVCNAGSPNDTYGCADACSSSGDTCTGDVCADAITVSQTQTFTGDLEAYASQFDFDGAAGCTNAGGTNIPTPGADIVFKLPNLTTSDTVTIDAQTNDTNLNRIFVLKDACTQPYACEQVGGASEKFDFTPSADGTYYVVIDKSTSSGGQFNYSFTFH